MTVTTAAGMPTIEAIAATAPVLPGALRESVELFAQDLSQRNETAADAADTKLLAIQDPNDLRVLWWPYYISNAWKLAHRTGRVDEAMGDAAPILIEEGTTSMGRAVKVGYVIAVLVAAVLIMTPLVAYYLPMFAAVSKMH
jgi:hypothetical protein